MSRITKIIFTVLFIFIANYGFSKGTGDINKPIPKGSDSTITTKSNIVIFKMIPSPTLNTNNGSLKKAGKVARTSISRP
ncbi:MAG TPA: hypothetical protein VJI69_06100 [Bacteroidia bacterium]|nr:hypothetical protein [Bacteroidia bacterium]